MENTQTFSFGHHFVNPPPRGILRPWTLGRLTSVLGAWRLDKAERRVFERTEFDYLNVGWKLLMFQVRSQDNFTRGKISYFSVFYFFVLSKFKKI